MRFLAILVLMSALWQDAEAQMQGEFRAPVVGTLRAYVEGSETALPVIALDGDERIVVEFDCLTSDILNLEYSVVHCNRNGQPSDLQPSEYLNGFAVNTVTDYAPSSGTATEYVNYRIGLPNNDVQMLLSGRYEVTVFVAGQPDSVVARASFLVYEQLASIEAELAKPTGSVSERHSQEVRLSVDCADLPVNDVFNELNVSIIQNGCPYSSLTDLKPKQIVGNRLVYAYAGDLLMAGGNEFRRLDLRYLRQAPINYNRVDYVAPYFHITPPADESRAFKPYFSETDQNGQYMIYAQSVNNADDHYRTADYVYVHPTLETEPVLDGDVFVCGAFCNWTLSKDNQMRYNFAAKRYEGDLRLKQGVYDYIYVCRTYHDGKVDMERFEGSHSATANSYLFLVFFRHATADYEQLVGAAWIE